MKYIYMYIYIKYMKKSARVVLNVKLGLGLETV